MAFNNVLTTKFQGFTMSHVTKDTEYTQNKIALCFL